jgi:Tfp pilus assembly protein PilE
MELLMVVVIIAVVAVIAAPGLIKTVDMAKANEAASNLHFIRTAQKRYFLANGEFAEDIDSLAMEDPNDAANRYFDYAIENVEADDFTARATKRSDAESYYEIKKDGVITSYP